MSKESVSNWLAIRVVRAAKSRLFVVSIPKRVVPLSTDRSRIRRLIREAVRTSDLTPPNERMFCFVVRRRVEPTIRMARVREEIKRLAKDTNRD